MDDAELVGRILSGEENLFAKLVERYGGYVWAFCSSYIANPIDCEDVTQEVFVQCYSRLDTLRNPAAFGPWLSQLARRCCLMWLRSSARRERRLARLEQEDAAAQAPPENDAVEKQVREELHQGIWSAVDALPPDYREALLLRFAEGHSVEEAAAFLGITAAAMRKRIERAQHLLRTQLWDQVEPALAKRRHKDNLVRGILAGIPFGQAPWLGVKGAAAGTSAAAGWKIATLGGIAIMSKKALIGVVGAIVIALLAAWFTTRGTIRPIPNAQSQAPAAVSAEEQARANAPATASNRPVPKPLAAVPAVEKQGTTLAAPVEKPQPASVSGFVGDEAAHAVTGADIHLEVGRDQYCTDVAKTYDTTTDRDGRYEISGIDVFGGRAFVFASADGYAMARTRISISPGKKLKDVNITLRRAEFFVAGRVVNQSKTPIPDASVDTLYYGYDQEGLAHTATTGGTTGNISNAKFVFTTSDKDGYFKLAIPSEGLCDLRVVKQGYGHGFFPKIATGTTDAELVLWAAGAIAGTVSKQEGTPVEGVIVRVVGEALPGGLEPSSVRIQKLPVAPVMATTDARGAYLAEGLGEDYVYTVSVPTPGSVDKSKLLEDPVRGHIAVAMRELDESCFSAESIAARKTDVRVKAGETTPNIDLVFGSISAATLHGTVTDRTTGAPACPVVVTAAVVDTSWPAWLGIGQKPRYWFQSKAGGSAVTNRDGSYELRIENLTQSADFTIGHDFMIEGGSVWEPPEEKADVVTLSPGDDRELNLTVDAPVTVPARYVSPNGAPIEGIEAAMRPAGAQRGGCGGTLVSDADGRVTFHGVRPFVSLEVVGWVTGGPSIKTVGASEPFTGQPGQTMPELTVVCRLLGGFEGMLVRADGSPVANAPLASEAQREDGAAMSPEVSAATDANGAFCFADGLPEGSYQSIRVGFLDDATSKPYSAAAANVRIEAASIVNLGTLTVGIENDWMRVLRACDWGRKSNEAIAGMYAPEWMDTLSDPSLMLKTGFALYDMGKYEDALEVFQRMAQSTAGDAANAAEALVWQGHMLDLLGRRQDAIAAYSNAAAMNVDTAMQHDQFGLTFSPSPYARERMNEPFTRIENRLP